MVNDIKNLKQAKKSFMTKINNFFNREKKFVFNVEKLRKKNAINPIVLLKDCRKECYLTVSKRDKEPIKSHLLII